jgi:outer membrane protein OmpA-like peptidoglycan-associated protein
MTAVAFALIFLAVGASSLATAQMVIGERSRPSVTVDTSVLESLGPPPTLPDLLRGKPTPRQTTATTSRQRPARTAAVHVPKKRVAEPRHRKRKPDIAARRATPVAPVAASGTAAAPREPVAAAPLSEPAPPTPAPTPPSEAPAGEPASTPTAAIAAPKAPEVAMAAPAEPTPAPPAKPAAPVPPPAPMPTTMAPTPVPPATPTRLLPTATPSSDARVVMNTPPTVVPPASVPATPPTQTAPPTSVAAAASTRVLFTAGGAELPDAAKGELDAMARQLSSNDRRLQLVGYAGSTTDEANQARRISLQRALAVRSYLMERGVPNTRMDVRALGNRADGKDPPDRVDLVMLDR